MFSDRRSSFIQNTKVDPLLYTTLKQPFFQRRSFRIEDVFSYRGPQKRTSFIENLSHGSPQVKHSPQSRSQVKFSPIEHLMDESFFLQQRPAFIDNHKVGLLLQTQRRSSFIYVLKKMFFHRKSIGLLLYKTPRQILSYI